MIIVQPDYLIAAYIEGKTRLRFTPPYVTLAYIDNDGIIRGAMLFQSYTQHDVEISVAAEVLPRSLLRAAADYVTQQLGCKRATFRTKADNHQAVKALERLGGTLEGRMKGFYGDCDALVYRIDKESFPYG